MGKVSKVMVETSARHVHLCEKDIDILFGEGYKLNYKRELSQPGQFACDERVDVIGPKKEIKSVIILGPPRPSTQVEISLTDARTLGVNAPVRESGDVAGSGACKLRGPAGEVDLTEGVIAAKRHIHLRTVDAEQFGVEDKQIVEVKIKSDDRTAVFGDVVVRVNDSFMPSMHIDTDEANACGASGNAEGEIIV
ncbi:MAG: phosphate propanoyltransferase [Oscillospiraceae bacterium]|nr:phosphate propanoyltransferase [Oscillospiraceae bacterium]